MYNTESALYNHLHADYWLHLQRRGEVIALERLQSQLHERPQDTEVTAPSTPKRPIYVNLLGYIEKVNNVRGAIAIARLSGFEETANSLGELLLYEEELEPGEQPLSLPSMKRFIRFLIEHSDLREPSIVITDEGNIKAIWQHSKNQIFWIEFYPNGDVRYLSFVPNERRSDGVERTAGRSTVSDIFDRAKTLGAITWMVKVR